MTVQASDRRRFYISNLSYMRFCEFNLNVSGRRHMVRIAKKKYGAARGR